MKIDKRKKIRDKTIQCNSDRGVAKISAFLSGKIDKYEYLTDEEILPSNRDEITEQAKFTYSPL